MRYLIATILMLIATGAYAEITFDGSGKWGTTFDCAVWAYGDGAHVCDGINFTWGGPEGTPPANVTELTAGANNSAGAGLGSRFYIGDGSNNNSAPLAVFFPQAQPEIWIRWYMRWQEGFNWSSFVYDKNIYLKNGVTSAITGFGSGGDFYIFPQSDQPNALYSGYTWLDLFPAGSSDGAFHCFEVYIKMDTDSTDGVGRLWIDGDLKISASNINWSGGTSESRAGWTYFTFETNQSTPDNLNGPIATSFAYVDYDDLVVYSTTPPNTDIGGNSFIGPISLITCYKDADGDLYSDGTSETVASCSTGYYEASALTATSGDCNDDNASINPGATDTCGNGIDEDCSGSDSVCAGAYAQAIRAGTQPIQPGSTPIRVE